MKILHRFGACFLVFAMLLPLGVQVASAEWNISVGYYGSVTMEMLEEKLVHENNNIKDHFLEIAYDSDMGAYRLRYRDTGAWYLNTEGTFPYVLAEGDVPAEDIAVEHVHSNKWLGLNERSKQVETVTQDALAMAVIELNDAGTECSLVKGYYNEILYYFICTPDYKYYCNSKGEMFVSPAEASATDLNRPYIDDNGDPLEIDKLLDLENNILNLPGAGGLTVELSIGNLSYDAGDKSYTVNAYTTINEGDNYYYTYYTYNIQYNITNTYITYIGSNDAYDREEYELYYQLPDGRSSADLTAEEVAGMSFEFYDVLNYQRSTDNVDVRALYHFDGNTDDSSYFSNIGSFEWWSGASITYMESGGAFEGALYLDNTAHSFDILLPSNLGDKDFQVQFRHYQASEPDTLNNVENKMAFGDAILTWDESYLYFQGTKVADLPVGTWHEIAVTRYKGNFYVYLNGLIVASGTGTSYAYGFINFTFGATSRAYTMLDELRVLSTCLVAGDSYYTPSVVPFDSNLVLILPDEKVPIADSYYQINPDPNDVFNGIHNYTKVSSGDSRPASFVLDTCAGALVSGSSTGLERPGTAKYAKYADTYFSVGTVDGGVRLCTLKAGDVSSIQSGKNADGLLIHLGTSDSASYLSTNTKYTFSLVYTNGEKVSFTFTTPSSLAMLSKNSTSNSTMSSLTQEWASASIPGGSIYAGYLPLVIGAKSNGNSYACSYPVIQIKTTVGQPIDIAYMELVAGSSSKLTVEEITAVYPSIDLEPNTAAIQTVIPVKGYTVGGVRPSMPDRGDCWFPVSNNRISSVQIYNGSMWQEVNARWWTGSRWIPIYAFDINTLEDLFDVADGDSTVPLLPDDSSFFRWWQLQWLDFRQWLESVLGPGSGGNSGSDCQHVYTSEVTRDPGCIEPGIMTFTCTECGHKYTQLIDAHGHDWITTDTVPDVLDPDGTVIEKGYEILTCSVCGVTAKDYGDGVKEDDLFDALGDLLSDGITWVFDKLTQMADGLSQITETFDEYVEKVKGFGGEYPAFFAAAFMLIPEELRILFWLSVIGVVVLAVWKKYSG